MQLHAKHSLLSLTALFLISVIVACTHSAPPQRAVEPSSEPRMSASPLHEGEVAGVGGSPAPLPASAPQTEKKVIRTAKLDLVVHDSRQAVDELKSITAQFHGEIDHIAISGEGNNLTAEMQVRVPADQLDAALARYKKAAVKVSTENVDAQDVTRQWVDEEARLKNLRETELQYRNILHSAHSVKDVLDVTEKLNQVRGEIESADAEHRALAHNIAMSSVAITLRQEGAGEPQGVDWHPWRNVRVSWHNLKSDLAGWADSMVALLLELPVILLWLVTVIVILVVVLKVIGFILRRFFKGFRWPWQKAKQGPSAGS